MFYNSKPFFFIILLSILLLSSACFEKESKSVEIGQMSFEDICNTIDGEWAVHKIKDDKRDCRKKSCRTGVGLLRLKCTDKKIVGEHFMGAKTVVGNEQWDDVTAEIENKKLSLSLKVIDKQDSNTEYKVVYEVEEVKDDRLFGRYTMNQVSNNRAVHDTRFIATKKLRTWKTDKP